MDERERARMVEENQGLVYRYAHRYARPWIPLDDLASAGNIGLLTAIDKFNPELGNKFSTYAVPWIRQAVAREAKRLAPIASQASHEDRQDAMNVLDAQADESAVDPLDGAIKGSQAQAALEALDSLKPRDRTIVVRLFGLDGQRRDTILSLAAEYGVSKQRISQLKTAALDSLRAAVA